MIWEALLLDGFKDFYYTDIPMENANTDGQFCISTSAGRVAKHIAINGSLIYDLIGLGVVFIQIFEWIA